MTVLSSVSSTSSGVGSSNVSSASSTTSETPSTDNFQEKISKQPLKKIAPKARISDDGDIEIETPSVYSKIKTQENLVPNRNSYRILNSSLTNRNSTNFDPRAYNSSNVYYVNAKSNNQAGKVINSNQVPQSQKPMAKTNIYYQQQNQLAAAAAAAAAVIIYFYFSKIKCQKILHSVEILNFS